MTRPEPAVPDQLAGHGGPPCRVLIVDDHPGFRRWAGALLDGQDYAVVGAVADGRSALAAISELRPDVVLLDVRLPDLDGFAVTRRLREEGDPPAVVLVSTRHAADYGDRIADSGAHGFIAKAELSVEALTVVLRRSLPR